MSTGNTGPNPIREQAASTWRWLGLPGVVLAAALLCDLAIVLPAAFDDTGPAGRDLLLLPGILAMAGCALWARTRPAVAAFAGAAVLVLSTVLIRLGDASPYSTVLTDLSITEVVAGFELVFFCVRRVRAGVAFTAIASLVIAGLLAAFSRTEYANRLLQSLVIGLVILGAAIAAGVRGRHPQPKGQDNPLTELLRGQWPVVGGLSLLLFLELTAASNTGARAYPVLLCSIAAAATALYAVRRTVVAALLTAGLIALSGAAAVVTNLKGSSYSVTGWVPITQVAAGMVVVTYLIRWIKPSRAWTCIGVLTVVVAGASGVNTVRASRGGTTTELQQSFVAAVLLLGISVAIGLYLRSRDSERKQVVQSAVTDAQTSERMALARELHDVVAHHVTGIVVQAQAAKMMGEKDPRIALEAMGRIENAGTEALAAMRRLVRSMRGDAPAGSSGFAEQATTDLAADLRRLVDGSNHGVPTEVELELPPDVPQEVARSALRLVQESLTNVGKHAAGAKKAVVLAEVLEGELHLWVSDDGQKRDERPAGGSGGYGLIGMRERVELLHGRLTAGPGPDGGWRVEAWLPLAGEGEQ
ncbi:sensor histidine kinase [Amycolatopsis nigrescens]|uniref:sensor histidine kinase n=1 Tax=Amycolatopsis nigrescens TaxID=381445 RepID=UPI00059034EF|nr:histidine kinase [Amycolatopsis nigrescens]